MILLSLTANKNKIILVTAGIVLFVCGSLSGFWLWERLNNCVQNFNFISNKIGCRNLVISKAGYGNLQNRLLLLIESEKKAGRLSSAGIYFRDLQSGPTFGIEEDDFFTPASLLKLPTVIAILKFGEKNRAFLSEQVTYSGNSETLQQGIAPTVKLKKNQASTIKYLLFNSIAHSDNISYELLLNYLDARGYGDIIEKTYRDLGLIVPKNDLEQTISVKDYASIFRLIFFASYLNTHNSDILLSWLSKADFKDGIVAPIPLGINVAHKFGERELQLQGKVAPIKQLHDCGIIYYPGNPYLLCIMTRGKDIKTLATFISSVSDMVYQEVDARRIGGGFN